MFTYTAHQARRLRKVQLKLHKYQSQQMTLQQKSQQVKTSSFACQVIYPLYKIEYGEVFWMDSELLPSRVVPHRKIKDIAASGNKFYGTAGSYIYEWKPFIGTGTVTTRIHETDKELFEFKGFADTHCAGNIAALYFAGDAGKEEKFFDTEEGTPISYSRNLWENYKKYSTTAITERGTDFTLRLEKLKEYFSTKRESEPVKESWRNQSLSRVAIKLMEFPMACQKDTGRIKETLERIFGGLKFREELLVEGFRQIIAFGEKKMKTMEAFVKIIKRMMLQIGFIGLKKYSQAKAKLIATSTNIIEEYVEEYCKECIRETLKEARIQKVQQTWSLLLREKVYRKILTGLRSHVEREKVSAICKGFEAFVKVCAVIKKRKAFRMYWKYVRKVMAVELLERTLKGRVFRRSMYEWKNNAKILERLREKAQIGVKRLSEAVKRQLRHHISHLKHNAAIIHAKKELQRAHEKYLKEQKKQKEDMLIKENSIKMLQVDLAQLVEAKRLAKSISLKHFATVLLRACSSKWAVYFKAFYENARQPQGNFLEDKAFEPSSIDDEVQSPPTKKVEDYEDVELKEDSMQNSVLEIQTSYREPSSENLLKVLSQKNRSLEKSVEFEAPETVPEISQPETLWENKVNKSEGKCDEALVEESGIGAINLITTEICNKEEVSVSQAVPAKAFMGITVAEVISVASSCMKPKVENNNIEYVYKDSNFTGSIKEDVKEIASTEEIEGSMSLLKEIPSEDKSMPLAQCSKSDMEICLAHSEITIVPTAEKIPEDHDIKRVESKSPPSSENKVDAEVNTEVVETCLPKHVQEINLPLIMQEAEPVIKAKSETLPKPFFTEYAVQETSTKVLVNSNIVHVPVRNKVQSCSENYGLPMKSTEVSSIVDTQPLQSTAILDLPKLYAGDLFSLPNYATQKPRMEISTASTLNIAFAENKVEILNLPKSDNLEDKRTEKDAYVDTAIAEYRETKTKVNVVEPSTKQSFDALDIITIPKRYKDEINENNKAEQEYTMKIPSNTIHEKIGELSIVTPTEEMPFILCAPLAVVEEDKNEIKKMPKPDPIVLKTALAICAGVIKNRLVQSFSSMKEWVHRKKSAETNIKNGYKKLCTIIDSVTCHHTESVYHLIINYGRAKKIVYQQYKLGLTLLFNTVKSHISSSFNSVREFANLKKAYTIKLNEKVLNAETACKTVKLRHILATLKDYVNVAKKTEKAVAKTEAGLKILKQITLSRLLQYLTTIKSYCLIKALDEERAKAVKREMIKRVTAFTKLEKRKSVLKRWNTWRNFIKHAKAAEAKAKHLLKLLSGLLKQRMQNVVHSLSFYATTQHLIEVKEMQLQNLQKEKSAFILKQILVNKMKCYLEPLVLLLHVPPSSSSLEKEELYLPVPIELFESSKAQCTERRVSVLEELKEVPPQIDFRSNAWKNCTSEYISPKAPDFSKNPSCNVSGHLALENEGASAIGMADPFELNSDCWESSEEIRSQGRYNHTNFMKAFSNCFVKYHKEMLETEKEEDYPDFQPQEVVKVEQEENTPRLQLQEMIKSPSEKELQELLIDLNTKESTVEGRSRCSVMDYQLKTQSEAKLSTMDLSRIFQSRREKLTQMEKENIGGQNELSRNSITARKSKLSTKMETEKSMSSTKMYKRTGNYMEVNKRFVHEMSTINHELNSQHKRSARVPRIKVPKPELVFQLTKYKAGICHNQLILINFDYIYIDYN
eukprot:TRINITY_DN19_c0_g2_i1.p1 TRINITY_DN19_c0_g2~~TRINITY_DN19_c0_g2_i1.p1  ORF type:complete len:1712 (-),score=189.33 TRINITY_DN19_c0_g2_i1:9524-14659(-)